MHVNQDYHVLKANKINLNNIILYGGYQISRYRFAKLAQKCCVLNNYRNFLSYVYSYILMKVHTHRLPLEGYYLKANLL